MSGNILENRVATLEREVEGIKRQQTESKQFERALLRRDLVMSTVQIIAMVLAIFGAGGYVSYQNSLLFGQVDKRFEQMEKRFEQMEKRFDDLKDQNEKRFDQMEKRFEDLKQVVLSGRERRSIRDVQRDSRQQPKQIALSNRGRREDKKQ
jgi:TolA-binding protein